VSCDYYEVVSDSEEASRGAIVLTFGAGFVQPVHRPALQVPCPPGAAEFDHCLPHPPTPPLQTLEKKQQNLGN
jgi:hypothetical protein